LNYCFDIGTSYALLIMLEVWCSSVVVSLLDLRSRVCLRTILLSCNNCGQLVHIHMPLSSSNLALA